jgi:UDP-2,3-diacylglucosamine pyrophosphatase LpxH
MARRYLVVSDLHLADVEDHSDGWKVHKSSRYLFDDQLDELVRSFVGQAEAEDELTLVLNGDIVDFDLVTAVPNPAPWPVSPFERTYGLDPTEPKAIWKLEWVLRHHRGFVATLARFVAAGHLVVYVMGNHDREFHFAGVQRALADAVRRCASEEGHELSDPPVRFEPWFYHVPGEIYAEHGNQYDYLTSYPRLLAPVVRNNGEPMIMLPMGNLSNRYMASRMGYFNPHSTDFILNLYSYLLHWLRFYAFTRRSLVLRWLRGSLLVVAKLLETKGKLLATKADDTADLGAVARRYDLPLRAVWRLSRMHRPPITFQFFRLIREFWIDRVVLAMLMIVVAAGLVLARIPLWAKVMVPFSTFPLLYFVYEWLVRGDTLFTIEKEIPRYAEAISAHLPVKVVTFGHTHIPELLPLSRGVVFVNSGTWAPILRHDDRTRLAPGYRNYLLVSFFDRNAVVKLDSWIPLDAPAEPVDEPEAASVDAPAPALEETRCSAASGGAPAAHSP